MEVEKLQLHLRLDPSTGSSFYQNVGIDVGHQLVKLCFVSSEQPDTEIICLELWCFKRIHFQDALKRVREDFSRLQPHLPDVIHVVGCPTNDEREMISELLVKKEVKLINELEATARGYFWMLSTGSTEDLIFAPVAKPIHQYSTYQLNEFHSELCGAMNKLSVEEDAEDQALPCAIFHMSSQLAFLFRLNCDRTWKVLFSSCISPATYMHLGRLLLGETSSTLVKGNVFEKLVSANAIGDRLHVDTQCGEMLSSDSSEYGQFKDDMPVFSCGKFADHEQVAHRKEDLAHSVVGMAGFQWYMDMFMSALGEGLQRVWIGGGLLRDPVVREEVDYGASLWGMPMVQHGHLRTGLYAAALGSMFTH